ncbi:MAG: hypothetical protein IJN92_09570 [Lachnospiraceae bacterium]|nr:hypothetical protein [Lachnospiraceae bacterium]
MVYTIIVNNRSYDLPKKTLALAEKLDSVLKVDSVKGYTVRQKYQKLHDFMKELVGEDNAAEMFGSEDLSEIDLSELTLAVRKVVDAYDKPVADYSMEKNREKIESLPIEKLISVTKAAQAVSNAEMMKK